MDFGQNSNEKRFFNKVLSNYYFDTNNSNEKHVLFSQIWAKTAMTSYVLDGCAPRWKSTSLSIHMRIH